MRSTFRNFLIEKGNIKPPSNDDGDRYDGDDDFDRHIDEWQKAFSDTTKSVPFVHNTPSGTHKWKNLRHAMISHASEGAHADILNEAPQELGEAGKYLRSIGKKLAYGNAAMELMLTPSLVSAIKTAQTKLSSDNPYKSIAPEDLADREFETHRAIAKMHINQMTRKNNTTPEELVAKVAPHIELLLNRNGPHGFMLAGGHYGLSGIHDIKPEFFPKWGPTETN